MTEPLLEVREARKSFGGVHAVDGVSFAIERGKTLALVGVLRHFVWNPTVTMTPGC